MRRLDLGSVNWWDGMLVAERHFREQERYHEEAARWLLRYGCPLYGVLPTPTGDAPGLELAAQRATDGRLRVDLLHCHAITRDGTWLHVDADSEAGRAHPVVAGLETLPAGATRLPVFARAAGEKHPLGRPDASGQTARRIGGIELLLGEEAAADDGSCLKLAEVELRESGAAISSAYLPPCAAMDAIPTLRGLADGIRRQAQGTLDETLAFLGAAPPASDMHPWNLICRSALGMFAGAAVSAIEPLIGWEGIAPPHFVGGLRAVLRGFAAALAASVPVREHLDEQFLQAGGLPAQAGGLDFHGQIARYIASPYVHEAMGLQLQEGARLLDHVQACLRFLGERLTAEAEVAAEAPRPKVTYRQQDYYLLEVGQIESSFSEESQVLYFRTLGTKVIRSLLFVLRSNVAEGVDERDIRLKGGVNDDRPLYCPDLSPDFKERPGRIYLLLEVERNKRDSVDYVTLRSSGVVDLAELLEKRETDVRVYYL